MPGFHVTRRKTPFKTKYHLHGCVLESVQSAKYLLVTLAEDLKWFEHINGIAKRQFRHWDFLKVMSGYITRIWNLQHIKLL